MTDTTVIEHDISVVGPGLTGPGPVMSAAQEDAHNE